MAGGRERLTGRNIKNAFKATILIIRWQKFQMSLSLYIYNSRHDRWYFSAEEERAAEERGGGREGQRKRGAERIHASVVVPCPRLLVAPQK